jgi:hypothetical protein
MSWLAALDRPADHPRNGPRSAPIPIGTFDPWCSRPLPPTLGSNKCNQHYRYRFEHMSAFMLCFLAVSFAFAVLWHDLPSRE